MAHNITITSYFRQVTRDAAKTGDSSLLQDTVGTSTIKFDYLPDSFVVSARSNFDKQVFPLSSALMMFYTSTEIPAIDLSIRHVCGLDTNSATVGRYVKGSNAKSPEVDLFSFDSPGGGSVLPEYATAKVLAKALYSMVLPETNDIVAGPPPPKSVLTVGNMFRGTGVFENVSIEFFGPYDDEGNPSEMEIKLTFQPSTFYNPLKTQNRVGINLESESEDNGRDKYHSEKTAKDNQSVFQTQLDSSPTGQNMQAVADVVMVIGTDVVGTRELGARGSLL